MSTQDIAQMLNDTLNVTVDRYDIRLPQLIKTVGVYTVDVVIHEEIKITINVDVQAEAVKEDNKKLANRVISDNAKANVPAIFARGTLAPNPIRDLHSKGKLPTKEEMDNFLHIYPELQKEAQYIYELQKEAQYIYSPIKDQDLEQ